MFCWFSVRLVCVFCTLSGGGLFVVLHVMRIISGVLYALHLCYVCYCICFCMFSNGVLFLVCVSGGVLLVVYACMLVI